MTTALEIADRGLADALGYRHARDAILDPRGVIVRCTPWRWTLMHDLPGSGGRLFRKVRRGRSRDALQEWRWLRELPALGIAVAQPLLLARCGRDSVIATRAVDGVALDGLLARVDRGRAVDYVRERVVPILRRLHDQRLVLRDAYFNHLFAASLADPPILIDVERILRPRWRWRRWVVKDLAGLVSSWPAGDHDQFAAILVRAYTDRDDRGLLVAVSAKARRIRAHRPRWG